MFSEKLCQSLFYSLPPFLPHSIPKYLRKLIYLPPDHSSVPPSENSYSTIPPSIHPSSISPLARLPHKLLPYITYCVPPSRIQSPFSGLTHLPSFPYLAHLYPFFIPLLLPLHFPNPNRKNLALILTLTLIQASTISSKLNRRKPFAVI